MEDSLTCSDLRSEYRKLFDSNKELLDSLYYAKYMQQGIMPHTRHFNRMFNEYFVFYKPQGIIGGDLYWIGQKGSTKYFAVGDCTGHGTSGAMLSVMAISFLNYIVLGKEYDEVGEVLHELDRKWIEAFHQGLSSGCNNDWLEIALCSFNEETRELQYAGAFSKAVMITDGVQKEFTGDKYPIGGWQLEPERQFQTHKKILHERSLVYLFSDGYKDQFGALTDKRFTSRRFRELLLQICDYPMDEQREIIEDSFGCWKGNLPQTDDVCVLGVRL